MRVTLDFPAAEEILQEVGLDEQGDAQMFHTKNVLRRIQKYMPYRTGATIKLTVAQTDPSVPEIVTEEPQAVYLYNGVSRSGKPLNYTRTKNSLAGGHWDRALVAAEGDALAAYITGAVCVTNQSNFGLYFTFAKSAGDDEGAKINADWVNDFQHWVQEQSAHGLAPNFGDAEEPVIARAQNGVLYEAEAEGTATYMVVLSLRYTKTYESEDFA